MAQLNTVETNVSIAGKKVHFSRMYLSQKFNAHHHVEIEIDHEEFGELWMEDPTIMINYIGQDINITMKHKQGGGENLFAGVVTNVSFSGYHGEQNSIIITGASPTIKLAGKPTMDSFMDLPLQQVVEEAVGNSGNGCPVTVNPKFGSKLDYVCQYDENCFDFLNRLSWEFGEWFFYDGQTCYFGKKDGEGTALEYDKEMTYFDLSANLIPEKFNRYHYLWHDDKEVDKEDMSDVDGVRGYLKVSENRSKSVYTAETKLPLIPNVNTKKDLDDLVKAEKSRAAGDMLIMRGKTQTCKVKIGGTVNINLPAKMRIAVKSVDTFLVTQVTHVIDQEGHYSNSFEAVMSGIAAIPMAEPKMPFAGSQLATVKTNADSKGRVKVQTQWQKSKNKTTNWIHVQTPDAGKSGKVPSNRGLVTIPEEGDTIMLGFEYGNPSRPYVAGSIFTESTGAGGGAGNKGKSLVSRSGNALKLDDADGSVRLNDKDGSDSYIEMDGSKEMEISADNKITIKSGDTSITLDGTANTITISADTIIIDAGTFLQATSGNDAVVSADNTISVSSMQDATFASQTTQVTVQGLAKAIVTATGEVALTGAIVKLN